MCGIAGIVGRERIDAEHRAALDVMLDRLAHRGPDDQGAYVTKHVALGHRRLSIIDLETGRQPIANEDGTVRVITNGEIYNFLELRDPLIARGHRFRSTGDSECLVHLYEEYGDRCLDHINGMFAIALWDEPRRRLLLARDRLGVKPLYYCIDGNRLIFASELKAILAAPDLAVELDATALLDYLTYGFIPSPKTIYKNIRKLSPGHMLVFEDGRAAVRPYWDLHHQGRDDGSMDELAAALWDQLMKATRPRLIADVPIGAFLSGGLDSGAVVAAMSRLARNQIVTVTCGFDARGFDERESARETAALLETRHHDGLVEPDAGAIVDELAWHFDEPFADPSAIPMYCLSRHARRFVKVALSGDGGDEILAGYRRYRFDRYEDWVRRRLPRGVRRGLFGSLASIYPQRTWMPRSLRGASTLRNLAGDAATAHGLSVATMAPREARALLSPDVAEAVRDYDPLEHARVLYHHCDAPDHLSKCQYVDIRLGLADGILTKVDRASMAHALEVRSPMLDYRFVESAWRIPPRRRIGGRHGKLPLRHAVLREVGPGLANRSKAGFDVPLDDWFKEALGDRFQDCLLRAGAPSDQWISADAIQRIWTSHASGRERRGATLWKLLMFDAWRRQESGNWKRGSGSLMPGSAVGGT